MPTAGGIDYWPVEADMCKIDGANRRQRFAMPSTACVAYTTGFATPLPQPYTLKFPNSDTQ